jgi:hypothetical protein
VKLLNGFFGFLLVLGVLAGCDLQVPESVPTRISEVRPERPTAEQPAPEQPAPEQPAEPTAEPPAPEQPTAPPAPLEPIPPPAPPADNRLIDTLLIVLTLAIIVVVFFLGRALGRDRQERQAAAAAAQQAAPPATIQNTFNAAPPPPAYEPPPPVAPPPRAPIRAEPIGDAQRRFVYYPGTDTIPVPDTPPIYDRSHTITIDLARNSDDEDGVLLALGSMQAGYAVYVLQGRLIYTLALGAVTKQISANAALPLGEVRIRYEFNRTGAFRGTGALFINEQLVGAQIFANTIPLPPAEGLDIGIDRGIPVTSDYPAPFPYQGTIRSVVYELTFDSAADQA